MNVAVQCNRIWCHKNQKIWNKLEIDGVWYKSCYCKAQMRRCHSRLMIIFIRCCGFRGIQFPSWRLTVTDQSQLTPHSTYLWITDTSYRNKHLVNAIDEGAPVHLGPIMLHFTRDEKTFELEILSANPNLKNISFIGVDLESAILTGLKTMIPGLFRLICMHHLMKRDESKHADLLPKTGWNIADRKLSLLEIIKDIYGLELPTFMIMVLLKP